MYLSFRVVTLSLAYTWESPRSFKKSGAPSTYIRISGVKPRHLCFFKAHNTWKFSNKKWEGWNDPSQLRRFRFIPDVSQLSSLSPATAQTLDFSCSYSELFLLHSVRESRLHRCHSKGCLCEWTTPKAAVTGQLPSCGMSTPLGKAEDQSRWWPLNIYWVLTLCKALGIQRGISHGSALKELTI